MPPTNVSQDLLSLAVLPEDSPADLAAAGAPGTPAARELDRRVNDGITVVLLWRPGDTDVIVSADDRRTGARVQFTAPGEDAMTAFMHPFAYAA